jgi:hypothetical protein
VFADVKHLRLSCSATRFHKEIMNMKHSLIVGLGFPLSAFQGKPYSMLAPNLNQDESNHEGIGASRFFIHWRAI